MSSEKPKLDVKEKAVKYGPKKPNKFILWINRFKKSPEDTQPSIQGFYQDKERNLFKVAIWKNTNDDGSVYFNGSMEDLGVKQNVYEMPKPQPKPVEKTETLDDDIPY